MAKSDETAKQLLNSINSAESEELKEKAKMEAREYVESPGRTKPQKSLLNPNKLLKLNILKPNRKLNKPIKNLK